MYLWGAGIDSTTTFGNGDSISFSDIMDNFDFGLMGMLEARQGKWMVVGDLIYLDISTGQSSSRQVQPSLPGGGFTIDSTVPSA